MPPKIPPVLGPGAGKGHTDDEAPEKIKAAPSTPLPIIPKFAKPAKRNFEKTTDIMHDLFKLTVATCRKNTSFKPGELQLMDAEHVHIFHTVDSHGITQINATPTGGHTHKMEVTKDEKGEIENVVCGEAIQQLEKRSPRGQVTNYFGPVELGEDKSGELQYDKHVHPVVYVRSEQLRVNL